MGALVGGLAWLAYVVFVVVPITVDAFRETALRQSSSRLTALIEQGQIQVNSPAYWHAIEFMIPPQ
jgi:RNA-binding protein YlmH